jgi:hypothetical protein
MMRVSIVVLFALLVFSGCSTDRNYTVTHERMTTAALQAISEEAHVHENDIVRTDREEDGGQVTYLEAPYIDYSKIKARIDSRGKDSCMPEFSVTITTDKYLYSRHKEWEQRIHELVFLKLRDRKYVLSDPIAENAPENPKQAPKPEAPKPEGEAKPK